MGEHIRKGDDHACDTSRHKVAFRVCKGAFIKKAVSLIFAVWLLSGLVFAADFESDIEALENGYRSVDLDVGSVFREIFSFRGILRNTVFLGGVSFFSALLSGKTENNVMRYAASVLTVGIVALPVLDVYSAVREALTVFSSFLTSFSPVAAAIAAASGKPLSGGVTYAFAAVLTSVISAFSGSLLMPLISGYTALCTVSEISGGINIRPLTSGLYKGAVFILSVFAAVFTAFCVVKRGAAAAGDSMTLRGIKFTVSSAFPVVGSALSDACAAAGGYLSGLSGTLGVLSVGILTAIFLPVCGKSLMWIITLSVSSVVAGIFGDEKTERLLTGIRGAFSLMWSITALFYFMAFMLVVGR